MIEDRTDLKEKRNKILWIVWLVLLIVFTPTFAYYIKDDTITYRESLFLSGLMFCLLSVVYRVLTFAFNSFLCAIFKKRWKINRLKGRVTPIYNICNNWSNEAYYVEKFSAHYTKLDLQWSIPFSVLFEEQEYVSDGEYFTEKIPDDLAEFWEESKDAELVEEALKSAKKNKKQQKIDTLNKQFKENYK